MNINRRDSWKLKNISERQISLGDLSKVPNLSPGRSFELLRYYPKEDLLASVALLSVIRSGWCTLTRVEGGESTVIDASNATDALTVAFKDELTGGGGSNPFNQNLNTGDTPSFQRLTLSGLLLNGNASLTADSQIQMSNGSYISNGTFDNGGASGLSLFCTIGYELNWQAGVLSMGGPQSGWLGTVNGQLALKTSLMNATLNLGDPNDDNNWSSHIRFTRSTNELIDVRVAAADDGLIFRNFMPDPDGPPATMFSFRDSNDVHIWDLIQGGNSLFGGDINLQGHSLHMADPDSLGGGDLLMEGGSIDMGIPNTSPPTGGGSIAMCGGNISSAGSVTAAVVNADLFRPTRTSNNVTYSQDFTSATIDWDLASGNVFVYNLQFPTTVNAPTNIESGNGCTFQMVIAQEGTSSLTFDSDTFKWPGGVAPTVSQGSGKIDIFTFYCDGLHMFGMPQQDFQ